MLIEWDPRRLYRELIPDEAERERFLAEVCSPAWNHEQDRGRPVAEGTAALLAAFPEHEGLIRAYYDRWEQMLGGAIEGSVAVLRELHASGVPLYALTNWSAETFPVARARYEFLRLFRGVLVSGEEGLAKPEPEFFGLLAERFGLEPARTFYVDDSPGHVGAARALGFDAVVFTGPERLRADLRARGLPS